MASRPAVWRWLTTSTASMPCDANYTVNGPTTRVCAPTQTTPPLIFTCSTHAASYRPRPSIFIGNTPSRPPTRRERHAWTLSEPIRCYVKNWKRRMWTKQHWASPRTTFGAPMWVWSERFGHSVVASRPMNKKKCDKPCKRIINKSDFRVCPSPPCAVRLIGPFGHSVFFCFGKKAFAG